MDRHAGLVIGRPSAALDVRGLVGRAWDLDRLAEHYARFVAEFGPYAADRTGLSPRDAFVLRTRLTHTFRQYPYLDPELPPDLVPAPPERARAVGLFHDLYAALEPEAQRYFDEVTTP